MGSVCESRKMSLKEQVAFLQTTITNLVRQKEETMAATVKLAAARDKAEAIEKWASCRLFELTTQAKNASTADVVAWKDYALLLMRILGDISPAVTKLAQSHSQEGGDKCN